MGAADVIPFMPVREVTMDDCVELAREVREGARDDDSTSPCTSTIGPRSSPSARRWPTSARASSRGSATPSLAGERLPDFGPARDRRRRAPPPSARGSRSSRSTSTSTAPTRTRPRAIARAVRTSCGGLPAAAGDRVPGAGTGSVTVSMNLVDHEVTGIVDAFDAVAAEAGSRGLAITDSEIVGLVPEAAHRRGRHRPRSPARIRCGPPGPGAADRRSGMSDMDEGTPPERSSAGWTTGKSVAIPQPAISVDVPLGGQRIQRFLDELASDAPTPGGGAWAGISAAAGAALIVMVARLTLKKKGFEDVAGRMAAMAEECDEERHILLGLADRDAAAYRDVMAAYKLPKETAEEQQRAHRTRSSTRSRTRPTCRSRSLVVRST